MACGRKKLGGPEEKDNPPFWPSFTHLRGTKILEHVFNFCTYVFTKVKVVVLDLKKFRNQWQSPLLFHWYIEVAAIFLYIVGT